MLGKHWKSGGPIAATTLVSALLLTAYAGPAGSETVNRRDFWAALKVAGAEIYLGHVAPHRV